VKTIFDIHKWDDPELVARWFKSRLDWDNPETPQYSGTGKSQMVNWADGLDHDSAKYRRYNNIRGAVYRNLMFCKDYLALIQFSLFENIGDFESTMLVGNFHISEGRLTVNMEISGDPNVCEALWFLSVARYHKGSETILPELDSFETNTPGHIGEMSHSVIHSYDPHKAVLVKKEPLEPFKAPVEYVVTFGKNKIISEALNGKYTVSSCQFRGAPLYPIIWNMVPEHLAGPRDPVVTKIYQIKFEV